MPRCCGGRGTADIVSKDRDHRRRPRTPVPDATIVSGRRAVTEAIRSGRATEILMVPSPKATQGMRDLLNAAEASGVPVKTTPRSRLDGLAADHQGVVARIARAHQTVGGPSAPRSLSERQLAGFGFGSDAIVVVLDGIVDPQNLGAAARSAEAVGCEMLVNRTHRAADATPAAVRASAGALLHLPVARVANIARALGRLQDNGFWVVGLDGDAPVSILDEPCPRGRVAVVIGSEGEGLSRLVRERCDGLVRLPMRGKVDSLNAAASLAAVLYAWVLPSRVE